MKETCIYIILILLTFKTSLAQETIDASNPNNFLLGGDQKSILANVEILPVSLIDIEPDPILLKSNEFSVSEAGLEYRPNSYTYKYWLNFTLRKEGSTEARIYVRSNLEIPTGMSMSISIINVFNRDGEFNATMAGNPVSLSNQNQILVSSIENGYTGDGEGTGYQLQIIIDNPHFKNLPQGFEIQYEMH
jgi:hypothetical protein